MLENATSDDVIKIIDHMKDIITPIGTEVYHFSDNIAHESPCMSVFWRRKAIRQGNMKMEE